MLANEFSGTPVVFDNQRYALIVNHRHSEFASEFARQCTSKFASDSSNRCWLESHCFRLLIENSISRLHASFDLDVRFVILRSPSNDRVAPCPNHPQTIRKPFVNHPPPADCSTRLLDRDSREQQRVSVPFHQERRRWPREQEQLVREDHVGRAERAHTAQHEQQQQLQRSTAADQSKAKLEGVRIATASGGRPAVQIGSARKGKPFLFAAISIVHWHCNFDCHRVNRVLITSIAVSIAIKTIKNNSRNSCGSLNICSPIDHTLSHSLITLSSLPNAGSPITQLQSLMMSNFKI